MIYLLIRRWHSPRFIDDLFAVASVFIAIYDASKCLIIDNLIDSDLSKFLIGIPDGMSHLDIIYVLKSWFMYIFGLRYMWTSNESCLESWYLRVHRSSIVRRNMYTANRLQSVRVVVILWYSGDLFVIDEKCWAHVSIIQTTALYRPLQVPYSSKSGSSPTIFIVRSDRYLMDVLVHEQILSVNCILDHTTTRTITIYIMGVSLEIIQIFQWIKYYHPDRE